MTEDLPTILSTFVQQQAMLLNKFNEIIQTHAQNPKPSTPQNGITSFNFDSFDENLEDFNSYRQRLENYFHLKNITGNEDEVQQIKARILINCIGPKHYQLLGSLVSPDLPSNKSYDELIKIAEKHLGLCPKPNVFVQQHTFLSRVQSPTESISEFVAALRRLTFTCNFNCPSCESSVVDLFLRAKFIRGLRDETISEKILQHPELTWSICNRWILLLELEWKTCSSLSGRKELSTHWAELTHAYSQLVQYRDKYSKRFSATNLMYLEQLIFVTARLIRMLGGKAGCPPNEGTGKVIDTKLFSLGLFLTEAQIDNINQFRLIEFANRSKLSHKLHGFSERYQPTVNITRKAAPESGIRAFLKEISAKKNTPKPVAETPAEPEERVSNNPILPVLAFLQALTSSCSDGRVVCSTQSTVGRGSLKFLLLNPAAHFTDIVSQSRSVVVCGGTMQPISEFKDQLFAAAGADTTRVTQFSCGHVIPPEHILPIVLTSGPTNKPFDFSYQNRNSVAIMTELGRTLDNFCNIVPGGIVCFFCSYDYEQAVFEHFKKSGTIDKLSLKKKIFREPRKSSQVDQVLSDYAAAVKAGKKNPAIKPNGALLFSVVGGKLSEGLNFSDDLGRCVIVVGMPYPNIKSPELQEKMAYLDSTLGGGTGQSHYENLCMKAVNQCIGRAVRHREDYATVLLLDGRYARPNTLKLLPGWIQTSLQTHQKMGPTVAAVAKFFAAKRAKNASQ